MTIHLNINPKLVFLILVVLTFVGTVYGLGEFLNSVAGQGALVR